MSVGAVVAAPCFMSCDTTAETSPEGLKSVVELDSRCSSDMRAWNSQFEWACRCLDGVLTSKGARTRTRGNVNVRPQTLVNDKAATFRKQTMTKMTRTRRTSRSQCRQSIASLVRDERAVQVGVACPRRFGRKRAERPGTARIIGTRELHNRGRRCWWFGWLAGLPRVIQGGLQTGASVFVLSLFSIL